MRLELEPRRSSFLQLFLLTTRSCWPQVPQSRLAVLSLPRGSLKACATKWWTVSCNPITNPNSYPFDGRWEAMSLYLKEDNDDENPYTHTAYKAPSHASAQSFMTLGSRCCYSYKLGKCRSHNSNPSP